jgi:hypothetical protein
LRISDCGLQIEFVFNSQSAITDPQSNDGCASAPTFTFFVPQRNHAQNN